MKIVITGGHHSSALPVIEELKRIQPDAQVYWFGHKYSVLGDNNTTFEHREITSLGIPFYELHAGKVYKTSNIIRLLKVPFGFFQAFILLLKIKPNVILSFGGYLAVPVVIAGWFLGIPSLTHEQTVVSGYANKVVALFVKKVLLSWPSSEKYYPKTKTKIVGLPLRKEIFQNKTNSININPNLPTIYITGGKTGSLKINNVVMDSMHELLKFTNVVHQCGDHSEYHSYENLSKKYVSIRDLVPGNCIVRRFVVSAEIGEVFGKASLIVSRSGAHTIMELLALEKPCILIPIPWVSHNEQYENALIVKKAGLAEILEEKDMTPQTLTQAIENSLKNISGYYLKDKAYKDIIFIDSAKLIVEETLKICK